MVASYRANKRHPLNRGLIFWGCTGVNNPPRYGGSSTTLVNSQAIDVDLVSGVTGKLATDQTERSDFVLANGPSGLYQYRWNFSGETLQWDNPPASQTNGSFSIFGWWKYLNPTTGANGIFGCSDGSPSGDSWWEFRLQQDFLALTLDDNTTKTVANCGGTDFDNDLNSDTWYYIGASRHDTGSSSQVTWWLNGEQDGTTKTLNTGTLSLKTTVRFEVGQYSWSDSSTYPGHHSSFRVYNRYVGADEARNLYHMSLRGYPGMITTGGNMQPVGMVSDAAATTAKFVEKRWSSRGGIRPGRKS